MKTKNFYLLVLAVLLGITPKVHARGNLDGITSWAYQLVEADPPSLAQSACDFLVIDYSRDGTDETAYRLDEIGAIQRQGKIIFAYLSIGRPRITDSIAKLHDTPADPFGLAGT